MDFDRISGNELEPLASETLRSLLSDIPDILGYSAKDQVRTASGIVDRVVELDTTSGPKALFCEVKTRAWPNEIPAIAHQLKKVTPIDSFAVLIAPYVSESAAEICTEFGLSWVDLAGNCDLRLNGIYIKVQGNPNPYAKSRGTAALYSPKSALVVHALLHHPGRLWTHSELANVSGVSQAQVSSVKKLIESHGWIQAKYGEIRLTQPRELLADWKQNYKPKRRALQFFTLDSVEELETKINEQFPGFALTEVSASERYAPYIRNNPRVAFYCSGWNPNFAVTLGLRDGEGGANVTVYQADELPFTERVNGVRCVSAIQTYLDLSVLSGRGQDAAEHLYDTVIAPRWR
jgi:Transcriptional regulator, AbiEi antitoxin, Type IV TA system